MCPVTWWRCPDNKPVFPVSEISRGQYIVGTNVQELPSRLSLINERNLKPVDNSTAVETQNLQPIMCSIVWIHVSQRPTYEAVLLASSTTSPSCSSSQSATSEIQRPPPLRCTSCTFALLVIVSLLISHFLLSSLWFCTFLSHSISLVFSRLSLFDSFPLRHLSPSFLLLISPLVPTFQSLHKTFYPAVAMGDVKAFVLIAATG